MKPAALLACLVLAAAPAIAQQAPPEAARGATPEPATQEGPTREPSQVRAGRYLLDRSHGKITWSVSHLGFSTYTGQITDVDATLVLDPKEPARSTLEARIGTASAGTLDEKLDAHLKTPDFFNVAQHPTATFKSTRVEVTGPRTARVTGDLTLLGATKPVTLDVAFNQAGFHPINKSYTVGFDGRTVLRRSEWGMTKYLPGVGDEVSLHLEGEFRLAQ